MKGLIGTSPVMQRICEKIELLSQNDLPVFIGGETGTGKDVCARTIHTLSQRASKPFVTVNCAALSKEFIHSELFGHVKGAFTGAHNARDGAIMRAQGGTLFFDEITELPLSLQATLLRFTEDFIFKKLGSDTPLKADIRIICASNKDINTQTQSNMFREDLYYRLCVERIFMPPLRDRQDDCIDIAQSYLDIFATKQGKPPKLLSQDVMQILQSYDWPGNIRELKNVISRLSESPNASLDVKDMPRPLRKNSFQNKVYPPSYRNKAILPLWQIEKSAIENTLHVTNNHVPTAATMLGIAPSTLYRKIDSYQIARLKPSE